MIYMIFEISCCILEKKKTSFNFHFSKTVIYGDFFYFGLKTPQRYKKFFKKQPKSSNLPINFHISLKTF